MRSIRSFWIVSCRIHFDLWLLQSARRCWVLGRFARSRGLPTSAVTLLQIETKLVNSGVARVLDLMLSQRAQVRLLRDLGHQLVVRRF